MSASANLILQPCLFLLYLEFEASFTVVDETTTRPDKGTTELDDTTTADKSVVEPSETDGTTIKSDDTTTTAGTSTVETSETHARATKPDDTTTTTDTSTVKTSETDGTTTKQGGTSITADKATIKTAETEETTTNPDDTITTTHKPTTRPGKGTPVAQSTNKTPASTSGIKTLIAFLLYHKYTVCDFLIHSFYSGDTPYIKAQIQVN